MLTAAVADCQVAQLRKYATCFLQDGFTNLKSKILRGFDQHGRSAQSWRELEPDPESCAKKKSGGDMSRGFGAVCGSPVVARFSRMPDLIGIPAASLDGP